MNTYNREGKWNVRRYELIKNKKYNFVLVVDERKFDYYTDVYIELINNESKIIIFKDNLLALKNCINQIDNNIYTLETDLDETKLGILLNDYYLKIYEDDFDENIETSEWWVGEKYCWFSNSGYITWLYRYCEEIILKITPIFNGFEKQNCVKNYHKFKSNYNDVFRESISLESIIYIKQLVCKLYDKLI